MKRSFLLMSLISLMLFSCQKMTGDSVPDSLDGTWKMIILKDNTNNTILFKPSSIQGDVLITFVSSSSTTGTFTGKTPSNDIWQNEYTIGPNQTITIPVLAMTKVGETSWGLGFVDNIRNAQLYSLDAGGKLTIKTTSKTLVFEQQ